jgi:hypothetical protein
VFECDGTTTTTFTTFTTTTTTKIKLKNTRRRILMPDVLFLCSSMLPYSPGTMPLAITEIGQLPAGTSPPTYFETNKFTSVFQGIVDTYGVGT